MACEEPPPAGAEVVVLVIAAVVLLLAPPPPQATSAEDANTPSVTRTARHFACGWLFLRMLFMLLLHALLLPPPGERWRRPQRHAPDRGRGRSVPAGEAHQAG